MFFFKKNKKKFFAKKWLLPLLPQNKEKQCTI